jgi:creatinine amidohydrolase
MSDDVRYALLRPAQIRDRREACPVVYIPIGTLEWHGKHLPVGADTLQAEGLAVRCARLGGGLVFPPLYYGESRVESLMEAGAEDRDRIAEALGVDPANFSPDRHPFTATEQVLAYQRLLLHVLAEAESLGFELGVLVAGHYPLIDHARAACHLFNQRAWSKRHGLMAWAALDYLLIRATYPDGGDHAARWETSHLMALYPETVDLDALAPPGEPLVGIQGEDPRGATPEFGEETLQAAAEAIVREVQHRLGHRQEMYRPHGQSMQEGLWKDDVTNAE